jgi:hypothetical protein
MNISNIPGTITQIGMSSSDLPVLQPTDVSGSGSLQSMLTGAFQQCGVDRTTQDAFLNAGMTGMNAWMAQGELENAASSFTSWMSSDSHIDNNALMTLAHGFNGVVLLAKSYEEGLKLPGATSLGAYSGATAAFLNVAKISTGLREGNISQVLFSGAKLFVAMALSGMPSAGIALGAAEYIWNHNTLRPLATAAVLTTATVLASAATVLANAALVSK